MKDYIIYQIVRLFIFIFLILTSSIDSFARIVSSSDSKTIDGVEYYITFDATGSQPWDHQLTINGKIAIPYEKGYTHIEVNMYNIKLDGGPYITAYNETQHPTRPYNYCDLFDKNGNKINIPPHRFAKSIYIGKHHLIEIEDANDYHSVYDFNGKCIVPKGKYISYEAYKDSSLFIIKNDFGSSQGIMDDNLNWIVPINNRLSNLKILDDKIIYYIDKGKTHIIDTESHQQKELSFEILEYDGNLDIVKIKKDGYYGLYDMVNDIEVVSPDYDDVDFIDGSNLVKFKVNGFWGVMTLKGKELIPTTRGYTDIRYMKGLKKFAYTMNGYKGECNSLGTQLSKIAVAGNNNNNSRHTSTQPQKSRQETTTQTTSSSGRQPKATGTYTISSQGQSMSTGNYTEAAGPDLEVTIEFYDDGITVGGIWCEYTGTSSTGKKIYSDPMSFGGSSSMYYVDENYNVSKQSSFTSPFGSDIFNYTVVKGRVNIPKAAPYRGSDANDGGSYSGSGRSKEKHQTKTYQKYCHLCHGSGKCITCNGTHSYLNPLTNKYLTCPNCKPDGVCSACGGTGKKN